MSDLKFNNVEMPSPDIEGISIATEPIWSKNTTRVANGSMTGDILGWVTTLDITWTKVTTANYKAMLAALKSAPFFPVNFLNPDTDEIEIRTFYTSAPKATLSDMALGYRYYKQVSVSLVQQDVN